MCKECREYIKEKGRNQHSMRGSRVRDENTVFAAQGVGLGCGFGLVFVPISQVALWGVSAELAGAGWGHSSLMGGGAECPGGDFGSCF